jgi:DNA-binding transcriptional ArsR family regulator
MVTIKHKSNNAAFRAIADPTRREILGLLRGGAHTVGEIAVNFRTSRPAISKHLRLLRSAGLVVTRKDGTARVCRLNAKPLRAISNWLREYEAFWCESLRGLKNYIEETERHKETTS